MEDSSPLIEHWRLKKRIFNRPPKFKSVSGISVILSKMCAQILKARGNSVHCEDYVSSGVSHLLGLCSPSAILFRVAKIVVDSIKRHSLWAFTHIFQKVFERVTPSITHRYSTSAVILIIWGFFIVASSKNSSPAFVCFSAISFSGVNGMSMLNSKTATRFSVSTCNIVVPCSYCFPAFTFTNTASLLPFTNSFSFVDYGKSCEFLTNQIEFYRHGVVPFSNALFSSGRPATTGAHCDSCQEISNSQQSLKYG